MAKVLVVDDVATELALLSDTLAGCGHEVVTASNGQQCLDCVAQVAPDIILLDVVMPEMDGFATCRSLKKRDDVKDIPVIMVTSKSGSSDEFWGKRQGAAEYITKPFSPQTVIDAVNRLLG